jgi:hypothetical protein
MFQVIKYDTLEIESQFQLNSGASNIKFKWLVMSRNVKWV